MLDWEGLLKFTLKNSDGTKQSNFKQMAQDDKKFLEGAMSQFCHSEINRIQQILKLLDTTEQNNQEEILALLEDLQELLDSLDKGNTLYKMGGHMVILKIIFYSKYTSCRIIAMQIFASANQNDAHIQTQSINCGALELALLINKEENMKLKENMMTAISSMIRGENLEAKRIFIKIKGLELLQSLMINNPSARLLNKVNTLLRDLIFYDQVLHLTYHDVSSFSNTSNLKLQKENSYDISYDANKEAQEKNQLPENKKYRGIVTHFLSENKKIKVLYEAWLQEQKKLQQLN